MARRVLAWVLWALAVVLAGQPARADPSGAHALGVAVLAFDADDAEDQADALTMALRSRVRASQGWSLTETTQSLGMLTAALRCPARPTPECQEKISDQLKMERYIWGFVSKAGAGRVNAEVHLYQRGKPDTVFREAYADNLKDANDDTLRKLAQRILEQFGSKAIGALVVRAGVTNGEIVVDGQKRVPLANGSARIELAPGGHSVELSSPDAPVEKKNVLITAGSESALQFGVAKATAPGEPEAEKPFPTKKVLGGVALAAGVALGILSVERTARYLEIQEHDGGKGLSNQGPAGAQPCEDNTGKQYCDLHKVSQGVSAVAWVAGAASAVAIGTGVYLLFLSSDSTESTSPSSKRIRVGPSFGQRGGGVLLTGEF